MINEQTIRKACDDLAQLLIAKNKDYGNSVQEQYDTYGETSLLIRLDDKMRRLKNLHKSPANVKNESKKDTLTDLAGYSILATLCLVPTIEKLYDLNYQPVPKYHDQDDQY